MKKTKKWLFLMDLCIILAGIILDQFTKHLAVVHLKGQEPVQLFPRVLEFRYLENRGAAFGIFQDRQTLFLIMTAIILVLLFYVIIRMPFERRFYLLHILCAVIIAGAFGNMFDRIRLNYVVDFIYFRLVDFPIFNVADIYVTCSCIIGAVIILFGKYKDEDFSFLKPGHKNS